MNMPFNVFVENQKKFYDNWMEMTKNMSATNNKETNNAGREGMEMFQDFFARQKELFEGSFKMGDPKDATKKMAGQYNEWMELQQSFFKKWMESYSDKSNSASNPLKGGEWMEKQMEMWKEMNQRGMEWLNSNLSNQLPDTMKPHFKNYLQSVEVLNRNWENISRMISNGISDQSIIEKMMNKDLQKQFMEAYFGLKMPQNTNELLDQMKNWFDGMISAMEIGENPMGKWMETWNDSYKKMSAMDLQPGYKMILDMQKNIVESSEPFFTIAGESKQHKLVRELRDLQFAFSAYVVHIAEMQQHLYEAVGKAMTETIGQFSKNQNEKGESPDFNSFFNLYVDTMENHLTEVLNSKEYSKVQSEMVKFGAKVKMLTEESMETMMTDMPFVPKSQGDEMSKKTTALNRKVRDLEKRVAELTELIEGMKKQPESAQKTATAGKASASSGAETKTTASKTTASKSTAAKAKKATKA